MFNQPLFLKTLSRFAAALPAPYDVERVLPEFTQNVTAILGLSGSGVIAVKDGRLSFVTASGAPYEALERAQEQYQRGPCQQAIDTGKPVAVTDVRQEQHRWPEYAETARRFGVAGVAGVPMRVGDIVFGALNIYGHTARDWSTEDLDVAAVLASVATGYIVNASKVEQLQQVNEQLQQALSSRVLIEQAKGITAEHHGVPVGEAFLRMRVYARSNNAALRAVAESIIHDGLRV
jgi:GAF domain-containing protein